MRATFFIDDIANTPLFDRRLVQFTDTPELPAPPQAFIFHHFKQAILANVRGAGQSVNLDFHPEEDSRNMSIFESGDGKEWLERELAGKLIPGIDDRVIDNDSLIERELVGSLGIDDQFDDDPVNEIEWPIPPIIGHT